MTNSMTNYNERLDKLLTNLVNQVAANEQRLLNGNATRKATIDSDSHATTQAKQAILRWVADEVIGEDEEIVHHKTIQSNNDNQIIRNSQRQKQRNILARHGYRGGE